MPISFGIFAALEAGFAPTPEEVARRMMEAADLHREEMFYDLGSGDGTLLITAAKEFGAHAVGFELQNKMVTYSRRRIRSLGLQGLIKVVRRNLFEANVGDADVVALYLSPSVLRQLRSKLEKELKPRTRVVTYKYPVEGWNPKETLNAPDSRGDAKIFLYKL